MKLGKLKVQIVGAVSGEAMLRAIESAGRTCYKSEDRITPDSAREFVKMLLVRGHESVLEHEKVTVRITCDRGVSHELVRHRLASFSQESTRYCNYAKAKHGGITLIPMMDGLTAAQIARRMELFAHSEEVYLAEIAEGVSLQQARDNLLTCLQTVVVMTANLREWRLVFKQRTALQAHPQMRKVMCMLLGMFRRKIPVVFDEIGLPWVAAEATR